MEDCLFCGIASGEVPAEVVYEDKHALAFLDVHPKAPGHTVVIPREHAPTLEELSDPEVGPLFLAVKVVAGTVFKALGADGLNIGINQNQAGGQVVGHIHVHIIPRFKGDGGTSVHGIVNNPPSETVSEIAGRIRNASGRDKK